MSNSSFLRFSISDKGSIVVFDKGFTSYPWFRLLGAKGVFFVTRLKRNAVFKLLSAAS